MDGPSAVAIGTTVACWLAGSSGTLPVRSRVSASATSAAQPSATVAARIERRSGSHTSGHSMAGPQCSSVRAAEVRAARRRRWRPPSRAAPRCRAGGRPRRWPRRSRAACRPSSVVSAASSSGSPSAGIRQSSWSTGRPWARTASANSGSPTFTTAISVGSYARSGLAGHGEPPRWGGDLRWLVGSGRRGRAHGAAGRPRRRRSRPAARRRSAASSAASADGGLQHLLDGLGGRPADGLPGRHDLGRIQHGLQVGVEQPPSARRSARSAASLIICAVRSRPADARPARVAHDVADDEVGGAVVDVADLGEVLGQVGRLGVALDRALHACGRD